MYGITGMTRARRPLANPLKRPLNARLHADDESTIILKFVLRAEDLRLRRVHLLHVSIQPRASVLRSPGVCCALVVSRSMIRSSWRW